jgi:hypothetical protein
MAQNTNAVVLYASRDLSNWIPIATNPPVLGAVPFLDTSVASFPNRFYRATQIAP